MRELHLISNFLVQAYTYINKRNKQERNIKFPWKETSNTIINNKDPCYILFHISSYDNNLTQLGLKTKVIVSLKVQAMS